jgi:hypothetical protein
MAMQQQRGRSSSSRVQGVDAGGSGEAVFAVPVISISWVTIITRSRSRGVSE